MKLAHISIVSIGLALAACGSIPKSSLPPIGEKILCENEVAQISVAYPTARVNSCQTVSSARFNFTIQPEQATDPQGEPINNSAWYGFRVDPLNESPVKIRLSYENGKHRYHPKISHDGKTWTWLAEEQIDKIDENIVELDLNNDGRPFLVSAQEIFTKEAHDNWTDKIASGMHVTKSQIGASIDGHPIHMLEVQTEPDKEKPYVVWVGRQHPPEVTGALALIPFTETVLDDTPLANRFLEHFNLLIIPMINPDGVTAGHWRFNKGGTDLNRDWGPFLQPETRAVGNAFKRFEDGEDRIVFFLDFHSTWRNLLYTQADDEPTTPPMFAHEWLTAVDDRLDDEIYPFTREARHNSGKPISKNYMYEKFGISSITYEVGDATAREAIDVSAAVFAEEMMSLLLKHETGQ